MAERAGGETERERDRAVRAVRRSASDMAAGDMAERAGGEAGRYPEGQEHGPHVMARGLCLQLLSVAPRTRAELATALDRRGVPENVAAEVLGRFAEVGLIDDV